VGLTRFFTVIAALDTGSSFEGMGASREVLFSALAEPALLLALAVISRLLASYSLSAMLSSLSPWAWFDHAPALALAVSALMVVLLAENARIPVDDPNTHLELTMIHEVMVLDHSGPDFALILYSAALKLWVFGALVVGIILPVDTGNIFANAGVALIGTMGLAVVVGVVESTMARLRLLMVPQLLLGASALAGVALILTLR
jgi:formate hydrogenlyase subunit 4